MAAVFLIAALLGWAVGVRVMAEPKIRIDSVGRLNELAASRQPEGANAWPVYEQAIEWMRRGGFPGPGGDAVTRDEVRAAINGLAIATGRGRPGDTVPTKEELGRMIELLAPIVRLIDEAAEAPSCLIHINADTLPHAMNEASESSRGILQFSAMNRDLMHISGMRGDWDSTLQRFRVGRGLVRHLLMKPSHLSAAALRSVEYDLRVLQQLCMALDMDLDMPQDVCERFLAALQEERAGGDQDIDFLFSILQLQADDFLQRFYSDDGRGDGFPLNMRVWEGMVYSDDHRPRPLERLIALSPDTLLSPSRRKAARADEREFEVVKRYLDGEIDGAKAQRRIGEIIWPLFKYSYAPRVESMYFAWPWWRILAVEATTEVMLRLSLHKARTGAWPATLEEAMTREQTLEPITGEPFRYILAPEDDERGRPYLLLAPESFPGSGLYNRSAIMNVGWPDGGMFPL